jgi:peptide/nickel transport system substrate-binding protein
MTRQGDGETVDERKEVRMLGNSAFVRMAVILCSFCMSPALTSPALGEPGGGPQGTLTVVDYYSMSRSVALNHLEGLVELYKDSTFVPCLAESWRWIDERTAEFKLRKGVTFHNGELFNAETVKLNWDVYGKMKHPTMPTFASLPTGTEFRVVDDYTVRFSFPKPDGLALLRMRWFFQLAPAFVRNYKPAESTWGFLLEPGPWGTGPFMLIEGGNNLHALKPSPRVVLEAYEGYWDKRYPKVRKIIFDNTYVTNREEAMRLCRDTEGSVDIVSFIRPVDTLKVAESPYAKVVKSRDSAQIQGAISHRREDSKFRDIRLRKALNYALDREELMRYAAKGNAYNLAGHIPPGAPGHNPELSLYDYNPGKAKALIAEAGYPDGFELTIIGPEAQDTELQVMRRMYERVGLRVNLDVLPFNEWVSRVWIKSEKMASEQKWDISVCYNNDMYGHSGPAHLSRHYVDSSDMRWIAYDPEYEAMWKDMAATIDAKAVDEKLRRMEQHIYDRAYAVFIYSPLNLYAVNKDVNFVPQKFLNLRLKETSVTDKHWSVKPKD